MSPPRYPLKDELRDPTDENAVARVWQAIDARTSRRRLRPSWRLLVPLGAGAAAAFAIFAALGRRDAGPLRLADGRPIVAVEAPAAGASLAMSDGSRIDLSGGARLEPLESSATAFVGFLERGSAHFEVRPGGPRRWQIECGLATVEVVGTGFRCERNPGRLRVVVDHGVVLVRGERVPDRARRLAAGESLEVIEGVAAQASDGVVPKGVPADNQIVGGPSPGASTAMIAPAAPQPPPDIAPGAWRVLVQQGRHREAFAALGPHGLQKEMRHVGVADLLVLADVARLSGHPNEAVAPLERILKDFPRDPQAPLAAFALGRLELDALGHPERAVAALGRALALGVPSSLREDVRARLVEAYVRSGDRAAARTAADAYEREFPAGRYTQSIESRFR